jgi:hypothetical protein
VVHDPQCIGSFDRFDSQPGTPATQSSNGKLQLAPHTPAAHVGVALGTAGHGAQLPHDAGSFNDASQPSVIVVLQFSKPVSQRRPHMAIVHVGTACGGAGHAMLHMPQFEGSVWVFTQLVPHSVPPQPAVHEYVPVIDIEHESPGLHARRHPPQSLVVSMRVSQPVASIPSQSPHPGKQRGSQRPAVQSTADVLGTLAGHGVRQSPHAMTLAPRSVSHPSRTSVLQSPRSGSQVTIAHVPVPHETTAKSATQVVLHAPQFPISICCDSQPSSGMPLQSK